MIEKRINYRFGGGYQGRDSSPVDRGGGRQESGGGGGRQEYSAQQYTAPKPTPEPTPRGEATPIKGFQFHQEFEREW